MTGWRGRVARGEKKRHAKLSEADVRTIRRRLAEGAFQRDVALEFGVSISTVSFIYRGQRWGHVA